MIRRDIAEHPERIERMDFFNDAKDTANWLDSIHRPDLAVIIRAKIEEHDRQWLSDRGLT